VEHAIAQSPELDTTLDTAEHRRSGAGFRLVRGFENAIRFFAKNGDRELNRWARIMFQEIEKSGPPT